MEGLLFATLAPLSWALMNVLDKYIVSKRVRNPLSYAPISAFAASSFGVVLAFFLDWRGIGLADLFFPALAGILIGLQYYVYYFVLKEEDVSHVIGLLYLYPVFIALLSYIFLGELLSGTGYIGAALCVIGAVLLSLKLNKHATKHHILRIAELIVFVTLYEFFIKIATFTVPVAHGIAINNIVIGLVVFPLLLHKKTRQGFRRELRNVSWAYLAESTLFLAVVFTYLAMARLPVTVVSSIGAIQPLAVLGIERLFALRTTGLVKERSLASKIIPICLIVVGVALLYLS